MIESDPLIAPPESRSTKVLAKEVIRNSWTSRVVLVQICLLILVTTYLTAIFTHPIIVFFAPHPILNSVGLVFLAHALLLTQPPPLSVAHKAVAGRIHGTLNTISVLLFVTGACFIIYNKYVHNAQHITTWHGLFGITTYIFLCLELIFGVGIFWLPEQFFGSDSNARNFYKYHRMFGYTILTLIGTTMLLALDSDYNNNVLHIKYSIVVPTILMIWGLIVYGLSPSRMGFT